MDVKRMENYVKKKKYQDFNQEQLEKALNEIKTKGTSFRKAATKYGVSKSTLNRYMNNKNTGKVGRPYVFDEESEKVIAECIALAGDWGFPLVIFDIRLIVKAFLDRKGVVETRFKNNMPGKDWAMSFIKRHKNILTKRLSQNVKRSRANVNEELINLYFDELTTTLKDVDPHLIVNYDETNLTDVPGRKNVIVRHGCRHPERIVDSSKQSTSIMFSAAADGTLLPPYVVYRSENLYDSWCQQGPKGTVYNRSKSGWFTMDIFENWFKTIILPYFKKFDKPKVLIGDNLTSHVSPWVIQQCVNNKIRFVFLPPNSTGLSQPLDVAFFKPLKVKWRSTLDEWKSKNRGGITKDVFPRLLNQCLISLGREKTINNVKAGFKGAGIVPIDRVSILKRLPTGKKKQSESDHASSNSSNNSILVVKSFETFLEETRKSETTPLRKPRKKKLNVAPGRSITMVDDSDKLVTQKTNKSASGSTNRKTSFEESSDELSDTYSVHDSSDEMHFSSSDNEEFIEVTSKKINLSVPGTSIVAPENLLVNSFVVVKIIYDKGTKKESVKKFIGQIMSIKNDDIEVKYLRKSSKAFNVYVFPSVDDIMTVSSSQVIDEIKPLAVSRGRYTFPYEMD